jgi:hypothetical protein
MSELIRVQESTKSALDKLKVIEREPYDSVIQRLIKGAKSG